MKYTQADEELETLIELNGQRYWIKNHWIKIDVRQVEKNEHRPHGIHYSLTLHDRNNTRILGFDNAHIIKKKGRISRKYSGRIVTWDHVHKQQKVEHYLFSSASQLLQDFWDAVNEIIDR